MPECERPSHEPDRLVNRLGSGIAVASSNIALAKYWGKRDEQLNLPYTGSISVGLAGLTTTATVTFRADLDDDRISLPGESSPAAQRRIGAFLNLVRQVAQQPARAVVCITSNFPVAAGLASSASTFAALALAASHAAGLSLSERELSILARRGSGSAARSVPSGYVEWLTGEATDGSDSYAIQLAPADHWELAILVAITDEGPKRVGSREGMAHVIKQSPYFPAWLASHDADLEAVRRGIHERDLQLLGQAAEHNCLKMHAASMAARPALLYWTPATLAVIQRVVQLRHEGYDAYFSIDAGPQVKVFCPPAQRDAVAAVLAEVPGVQRLLCSTPGGGVRLAQ